MFKRDMNRFFAVGAFYVVLLAGFAVCPSPFAVEMPGLALNVFGDRSEENTGVQKVNSDALNPAAGNSTADSTGKVTETATEKNSEAALPQRQDANGDESQSIIYVPREYGHEVSGSLRLLTVSVLGLPQHPATWGQALLATLTGQMNLISLTELYGDVKEDDESQRLSTQLMAGAQENAVAAAERLLGMHVPEKLQVAEVARDTPAVGVLQKGDVLVCVNGKAIENYETLHTEIVETFEEGRENLAADERAVTAPIAPTGKNGEQSACGIVEDMRAGAGARTETSTADGQLVLEIVRDGQHLQKRLTPKLFPGADGPVIGIGVEFTYTPPIPVKVDVGDIGGPSAGLTLALGVYDRLSEKNLIAGRDIAATGTVSGSGKIGRIGGLPQKIWAAKRAGATTLFFPFGNCQDLPRETPANLQLIPVTTLAQTVQLLAENPVDNPPSCPAR